MTPQPTEVLAVFGGPVRVEWDGRTRASFTVPNPEHPRGQEGFIVEFKSKTINHPEYGGVTGYDVGFYRAKDEGAPWQYKPTGTKSINPAQVFGGVIAVVREFLAKKPDLIWFVADEPGRARLYNRLLKKMAVPGYAAEVTGDGKYTIIRESYRDAQLKFQESLKTGAQRYRGHRLTPVQEKVVFNWTLLGDYAVHGADFKAFRALWDMGLAEAKGHPIKMGLTAEGRKQVGPEVVRAVLSEGRPWLPEDLQEKLVNEHGAKYRVAAKHAPSFPNPQDEWAPTNEALWQRMLDMAKGDAGDYTMGGKTIKTPNNGAGYRQWPSPNAVAWAVKQYNGLGGAWRAKEAKTQNFVKLEALIKDMTGPMSHLDSYWAREKDQAKLDQFAKELGQAAVALYKGADIIFEDVERQAKFKKIKLGRRLANFRKLVKAYTKVRTYEDAKVILDKHATKSKRAYDKLREYAMEALAVLNHFDSEVAQTIKVEDYSVTLINTGQVEWTSKDVAKLQELLKKTNQLLNKAGVGKATGGRVFAYPSGKLTGATSSPNAEASYNIPGDTVRVAIKAPFKQVLHALVHELGHRVYYKTLGGQGRLAWEQFFGDNVKPPDLDGIMRKWDKWRAKDDHWAGKYGKWLSYFLSHLNETGDSDTAMWLNMIAGKWDINEDLNPMTGAPRKKNAVPGYDQIMAKKDEIKVFLYPVSAYSGKDASELFAEVFGYMLVDGPGRVPEIVRDAFGRAVPSLRTAAEDEREVA